MEPNAYYHTFGHTANKTKFRLVLFLDTVITDPNLRDWIQDGLITFFKDSTDLSTSDRARFFYGSDKRGFVLTEKEVPLYLLTSVLDSDKLKGGGRMRKIGSNSSYHDTSAENHVDSIINNNKIDTENHWTLEDKEEYRKYLLEQRNSGSVRWDKLEERIKIFHDFMHREERLCYSELLGISQNMVWLKGGAKLYRKRLEEFNENHQGNDPYPRDGRFELCRWFHKRNKDARTCYFPQRLENFSPYEKDWKYRNLITAERDFVRGVQVLEPTNKATLINAEQMLQYKLNEALDDLTNGIIWLFKLPTGIGKTYQIKDLDHMVIAAPNHDLKNEILYDKRNNPHTAIATPEVPTFQSQELNNYIASLYELGLSKLAYRKILEVSHQVVGSTYSSGDVQAAKEYINRLKECYATTSKTVFTTHSRAIFSDNLPYSTTIIDEDPMEELLRVQSINLEDLQKLSWSGGKKLFEHSEDTIWDLLKFLVEEVKEGEITQLPHNFNIDLDKDGRSFAKKDGINSNLVEFLRSDYIYKEEGNEKKIFFVNQHILSEDRKHIILSATLNIEIYKQMYGNRVKVVDLSDVETKGEIIQHTKKSYSRSSLEGNVDELNRKLKDKPTLTFMKFAEKLKNGITEIYYGKSEGFDSLKGKDINVVGTPFKNQALYLLMGKCLGINVDRFNREFKYQNVEDWNGFRFSFNTFSNPELRAIHLADLEAELIQLIGRARALREDVQVDVYSSLPLRITDKFIYN